MDLLGPVLEIVNKLWTPIGKCLKYHISLGENVEILKRKLEELNSRKGDIESKLNVELVSAKKPKEEVEFWLREVQRINDEIQTIDGKVKKVRYLFRARLGRRVVGKIQEVVELHQKGSFPDSLVLDAPPGKGVLFPPTTLAGETTKKSLEEIWNFLMNDETRLLGVYGMAGVGKTTVMQQISNRLLKQTNLFDKVIWVPVSKVLDVIKLQDCIAKAFNLDLSGHEGETIRAAKLFAYLSEKKRYVLILDDVWEVFELKTVGIPEPTMANGWKIVITTRSFDVCQKMKCKGIKIELLSKDEAWNLFLDAVGHDVLPTPSLEATMRLVAEECACLPLAIITVAGSMKGKTDEYEWRNTLEELREATGGLDDMEKVLVQLKHSYLRLKDEKLQHCLLYCALYPEDFEIRREELIKYLIDEGIVEEKRNRQAEFDKGHSLLNKLENACLLESVTHSDKKFVKMHDLVRDMALEIMSRKCMVEAGVQLTDLPDEEQWTEDLERVSLMNNYIREIQSGVSPRCSKLLTLLLSESGALRRIPDSFFVHMVGLRVLDLSGTSIKILPNSISNLVNLTALLLRRCLHLKYVPWLAKLRELRRLDFDGSGIEEVPRGLEMLVSLRCLNLNAKHLKVLPAGILPKLFHIQCLIVWWGSETLKVNREEVAGLGKLETFAGQFNGLHDFNLYVQSWPIRGLTKYLLQVGPGSHLFFFYEAEGKFRKHVKLRKCSIGRGGEDPLVLPDDIDFLEIQECHDVSSLCDVLSLKTDFLKGYNIINCDGIECLLSSLSSSSSSYFTPLQSLEELQLCGLNNLRSLIKVGVTAPPPPPPPPPSLAGTYFHLRMLLIEVCPNIKKLFTPRWLPLQNLEEIFVSNCEKMEEIIADKVEGEEEEEEQRQQEGIGKSGNHSLVNNNDTIIPIVFPKLKRVYLSELPELKSIICIKAVMVCDSLHEILVDKCPKLRRLPLYLPILNGQPSPPPALKFLNVNDKECWESLEWDHPSAGDVLQPFVRYT